MMVVVLVADDGGERETTFDFVLLMMYFLGKVQRPQSSTPYASSVCHFLIS